MNDVPAIRHIGVIMDGNRRWATEQGQSKFYGYENGFKKFIQLIGWCLDAKTEFLTVYAFSTENLKRNEEDFKYIYDLILNFFKDSVDFCSSNEIVFKFIGRTDLIGEDLENSVAHVNSLTSKSKLSVQIAFGYGGRDEMVRAMRSIAEDVSLGKLGILDINEVSADSYLDTSGIPDVDMIIRTGKANRLSNFLLWQSHYAEIYFLDSMWPTFSRDDFDLLIEKCLENKKIEYGA